MVQGRREERWGRKRNWAMTVWVKITGLSPEFSNRGRVFACQESCLHLFVLWLLRLDCATWPRIAWNLLYTQGWPWTNDPPSSASSYNFNTYYAIQGSLKKNATWLSRGRVFLNGHLGGSEGYLQRRAGRWRCAGVSTTYPQTQVLIWARTGILIFLNLWEVWFYRQ